MNDLLKYLLLILLKLSVINVFSQYTNAIRIKIEGNGFTDETIIRLIHDATDNFDGSYDAWKIHSSNPNAPSIYTQVAPGQELSINTLPEYNTDQSLAIFTNIPSNGNYSIEIEEIYEMDSVYKISLTDLSSNTHFLISGDTSLSFNMTSQLNKHAFDLNISTPPIASKSDESCFGVSDGEITVDNAGNTNWNFKLMDNSNNLILDSNLSSNIIVCSNLTPGHYKMEVSSLGIVDLIGLSINGGLDLNAGFDLDQDTTYLDEGGFISFTNTTLNGVDYHWDFGDGNVSSSVNPTHSYTTEGIYQITLTSVNTSCVDQVAKSIEVMSSRNVVTSVENEIQDEIGRVRYVSSNHYVLEFGTEQKRNITLFGPRGRVVYQNCDYQKQVDLRLDAHLSSGIYILGVSNETGSEVSNHKIMKY